MPGVGVLSPRPGIIGEPDEHSTEASVIAQLASQRLGFFVELRHPGQVSDDEQRGVKIEPQIDGASRRLGGGFETRHHLESLIEAFERVPHGSLREQGRAARVQVLDGAPRQVGRERMTCERIQVRPQPIAKDVLDGADGAAVKDPSMLVEQRAEGHLLGEGVLEHQGGVVGGRPLVEEFERLQRLEAGRHAAGAVPHLLDEARREFSAQHGGGLEHTLGVVVEPIDARRQDGLDRSGDGE